jgi:RND family efflux transporter MFP subunit
MTSFWFKLSGAVQVSGALIALLVLMLLLAACQAPAAPGSSPAAGAKAEIVRPVKVAVVGAGAAGRILTYSGVVRPRIESALGFRVPGKVVERTVNVGDRVEVGQMIARLDDTDLKLAESAAKAVVAGARTRRDVASDNVDRAKALLPRAIIAQAAYDARRNEFDAAVAALDSAEAQLRQAANAVEYATLKADNAGIVTAVMAEPGQVVNAGQSIITLAHAGEMEIAVAVPEQDAGDLQIGQPATITLWAGPHSTIHGRIREIAGQADAVSRTYSIRIAVGAPPRTMRLGMTASVAIRVDDHVAPVVVPITAITESDGSPQVFVADPATKVVHKTAVVVGGVVEDGVKISEGLHAGELVVTAGVQFLRDGMRVRLPEERRTAHSGNSG